LARPVELYKVDYSLKLESETVTVFPAVMLYFQYLVSTFRCGVA